MQVMGKHILFDDDIFFIVALGTIGIEWFNFSKNNHYSQVVKSEFLHPQTQKHGPVVYT